MNIEFKGSPNFNKGRSGKKPIAVVLHIMSGTLSGTDAWFANPSSDVSAHYGIGKKGEIHQYVKEEDTAWANGVVSNPTWKGYQPGVNPNLTTISIEHEGYQADKWTEEMKKASAELVADICKRQGISVDREHIIGHYEIRSTKPNCPAENKSIIDEIIELAQATNDEDMKITKKLKSALKDVFGADYGDKLNENEMDDLAAKILKLESRRKTTVERAEDIGRVVEDIKKI